YLMEGSYNKVFLAKGNIPAESYTFFIDILLDTISELGLVMGLWITALISPPLAVDMCGHVCQT
ncbi:proteasome 26S subunit, non-ATPase 8, partial [Homo sapiens]